MNAISPSTAPDLEDRLRENMTTAGQLLREPVLELVQSDIAWREKNLKAMKPLLAITTVAVLAGAAYVALHVSDTPLSPGVVMGAIVTASLAITEVMALGEFLGLKKQLTALYAKQNARQRDKINVDIEKIAAPLEACLVESGHLARQWREHVDYPYMARQPRGVLENLCDTARRALPLTRVSDTSQPA